jgi:DNA mismatch repair protein MutS
LEGRVEGAKNYRVTVKEFNGSVVFLHKIVRGGTNKSFGIEVASLAGVPSEVCDRAREIVLMLENSSIDYNIANVQTQIQSKDKTKLASEVVSILSDIDINRVSPIEAFDILNTLVNKVNNNE